jgi:site-specific DNA recombinase
MRPIHAAIDARVSSAQQAEAHTVASQVAALCERIVAEGLTVPEALPFIDAGSRGATLVRPAVARWRDLAAAGAVDRRYVHSPDRLARTYAYQVRLVDELQRAGVAVIFLNRELGRSPEDDRLLHVQGMMAAFERAKISERHRRGKLHAARAGIVNVLSGAPDGSRSIPQYAGPVAMPTMGSVSAPGPVRATPAPTPLTGAWEPTPTALEGSGFVPIRKCGRSCWSWPCGRQSVPCWPTPSG